MFAARSVVNVEIERIMTVQLPRTRTRTVGRTEPRAAMRPHDTGLEGNRPVCNKSCHKPREKSYKSVWAQPIRQSTINQSQVGGRPGRLGTSPPFQSFVPVMSRVPVTREHRLQCDCAAGRGARSSCSGASGVSAEIGETWRTPPCWVVDGGSQNLKEIELLFVERPHHKPRASRAGVSVG